MGFIGISHIHHTFLRSVNQSFDDMSFAFKLLPDTGDSYLTFGNYDEVMKLGYQETGISTKDVVFAQVLDLFRIADMRELQAGWWLVQMTAEVHGHSSNLLRLRLVYLLHCTLPLCVILCCIFASRRGRKFFGGGGGFGFPCCDA
eukprot:symbB.v1.2.039746.t1/scaffold6763.1/size17768/1